jgi:predicted nucleic acid-binding protein
MIVLDASVVVNLVGDDGAAGDTAREVARSSQNRIAVPDLVDVESVAVLRRRWLNNGLTAERFRLAVEDLTALPFQRFPAAAVVRSANSIICVSR